MKETEMNRISDDFIAYVSERNVMQGKYLSGNMDEHDKKSFDEFLNWLVNREGYNISYIADAYLLMWEDTMNETKYFVQTMKWGGTGIQHLTR